MRALLLILLLLPSFAAAEEDPLEILWSHAFTFAGDGSPLVSVRLDEGESELRLVALGGGSAAPRGREEIAVGEGGLRFTLRDSAPAQLRWSVRVAELPPWDEAALERELSVWRERGFSPTAPLVGSVYGLSGHVLDNRKRHVLLGAPGAEAGAKALLEKVQRLFPEAPAILESVVAKRPSGTVEMRDASGRLLARAEGAISLRGREGVRVQAVEHDIGYASHGRSDRSYRGAVVVTVGADGRLAAVNLVPLETLIRGIVPSEIFATAPDAALRAQAVTARGEVLAKIGRRHLGDPWMICAEQHCQVYKGKSGEHAATDRAIAATEGEVLLDGRGRLVDSVYSSTCGGHTESNEHVWGTPPDPNLRGVPDWIDAPALKRFEGRVAEAGVASFLEAEVPSYCAISRFSRADKFRWERRFSDVEMNAIGERLGVGSIVALEPLARGVSGRATGLTFRGRKGTKTVEGELAVRRLLGNLNSSLFVVERGEGVWRFVGAGWGHGVGMCQTGAIGRAERGHDHVEILGHYYGGARPLPLYGPAATAGKAAADKSPSARGARE